MVISEVISRRPGVFNVFSAPERDGMRLEELRALTEYTVTFLNQMGAGRADRIAVVLPNGPELAAAFVSISAGAVFAPLNPAFSEREFEFYFRDLAARLLVTVPGFSDPAVEAAKALDIPIIALRPQIDGPAGAFTLEGGHQIRVSGPQGFSESGDTALLLHSSGTTSRPKLIPLTHGNLTSSALNIANTLSLTPEDSCLNIMPLFHIHGLVGALLSSLSAGASVCCAPGFNALQFFRLLHTSSATWYTAVPAMHQMILSRNQNGSERPSLQFVRSSSAHLFPKVQKQMEDRFECPVLNAYGMTEASHQIASNPLPPGRRKAGTVGMSGPTRVIILDSDGKSQPPGATGEVAIRGDAVTNGYISPVEANKTAFHDGWLRTGDLGIFDSNGYLTLVGRLKEIINCGGEKVSPGEIEEALLEHPDVSNAVCFPVRCQTLGEKVCAAVVLNEGTERTETELKSFVRDRLARFKVPRELVIVEDIPRGATGKIQRLNLAEQLGLG